MAQPVLTVAPDQEEAELLARLAEARKMIRHAIIAAGLDPGIAAGACAELAGEYAAAFAATRDLPSEMLLETVAEIVRWRRASVRDVPWLDAA